METMLSGLVVSVGVYLIFTGLWLVKVDRVGVGVGLVLAGIGLYAFIG